MPRPLPPWIREVFDAHKFHEQPAATASRFQAVRQVGSLNAVVSVHDRDTGGYRITMSFVGCAGPVVYPTQTADFGTEYELDLQLRKLISAPDEL